MASEDCDLMQAKYSHAGNDYLQLLVTSHAKMEENALVLINAHVLTGTLGKCAKQVSGIV